MGRPTIVILNGTCLDVVDRNREWLGRFDAHFVIDQDARRLGPAQVDKYLRDADALILPAAIRTLPHREHMERYGRMRVLSIAASGYDWLDVAAATEYGIVVTYSPVREGAEVVADMAWGLMLAAARQIPHHDRLIQMGDYTRGMGTCLWRKTLGIVGLGNIGRAVARRAAGFEMKVVAVEPQPDMAFVREHGIELVALEELLRQSDVVTLHVRLDERTAGMIGPRQLAMMKPTAILVNTARDKLIDEPALTEAILNDRLGGAGLDDPPADPHSPLLGLANVIFTPHLGNRAIEGVEAVFRSAIENAAAALGGQRVPLTVNPQVYSGLAYARRFDPSVENDERSHR